MGNRPKGARKIVIPVVRNTKDMKVILATRYQSAYLIVAINKILASL